MSEFLSKKWLVLINPVSGGGKVKKKWSKIIKKEFDTMKLNYTEYFTIAPEDAIHKIEEEIANYDGFIAVGGDGTCNEVLNGILYATVEKGNQNDKLLAMIPAGTGNDLCHAIGIPYKDALEACDLFKTGQIKKIDTGKATGKTFAGDDVSRYFCGVLSTGFDAEVAHKTNTASKWLPGTTNYIKSLLTTLLSMKTRGYTYKANGKEVTENGILLAVGLGPYYGGGMMICPNAKVDDGIFDIVFLRKVTRRTLLRVFPKVYDGKHITHKAVVEIEAPSIDISNTIDTIWQVDGEIIGNTPVKVTTVKEGLNVLVQQKTSLARAISTNAKLMILDEPISALDPAVRLMLRFKLRDLIKKLGLTAIHVTHDQDIAMSVADKIILMKGGRIVRYGTPQQMYNEPEHIFEAFFVGEGNFLAGKITEQSDETITVQLKNKVLVIKKREQNTHLETGTEIILFSRPENTFLTPKRTDNSISGIIKTKTLMNGFYRYEVETSTEDIVLVDITLAKAPFSISEAVFVKFKSKTTILFKMPENGLEEEMKLE